MKPPLAGLRPCAGVQEFLSGMNAIRGSARAIATQLIRAAEVNNGGKYFPDSIHSIFAHHNNEFNGIKTTVLKQLYFYNGLAQGFW